MRLNKGRKTHKAYFHGGPFNGLSMAMYSPGTMSFRVSSFSNRKGHYNNNGYWEFDE